jgi:hypothetical protein
MVKQSFGALVLVAALAACGEGEMQLTQGTTPGVTGGAAGTGGQGAAGAGQGGVAQGGAGTGGKAGAGGKSGAGGKAGQGGAAGKGTGGVSGGGQAGAGGTGPVVRTVETRRPFGNVAASDNLLWDGDFEWSGAFVTQYPWVQSTSGWDSSNQPNIALGGKCRSGIKCAVVTKNAGVAGVGMSPPAGDSLVRAWAHVPDSTACNKVKVYLASCFEGGSVGTAIPPTSPDPDASGWCQYQDTRPSLAVTPCVIVVNKITSTTPIYVDDVYLGPAPSTPTPSAPPAPLPPGLQPAEPAPTEIIDQLRAALLRLRSPKPTQRPAIPTGPVRVVR